MFVSPHVEERRRGFALLYGSETGRRSILTPHLLAARIDEPDLELRAQIVHSLADYYEIRGRDFRFPVELRGAVTGRLRKYEKAEVLALLELHQANREERLWVRLDCLVSLLERIPEASTQLTRFAGDRGLALPLRQSALELIGLIGFTDACPALQGLRLRLEGRSAGQQAMLFAASDWPEEQSLLPALIETLAILIDDE
jgi:hypothetical protein